MRTIAILTALVLLGSTGSQAMTRDTFERMKNDCATLKVPDSYDCGVMVLRLYSAEHVGLETALGYAAYLRNGKMEAASRLYNELLRQMRELRELRGTLQLRFPNVWQLKDAVAS